MRADRAERDVAEVQMLRHAGREWCAAHEVTVDEAATVVEHGRDTGLALAGAGAPCVSEFAVIELAAALGMTADACRRYVGQVLEVRYRLPRLWARVTDGELPWWRAARIADHTQALPTGGCGPCGPAAGGGGAQGRGGPDRAALPGGPGHLRPRRGRGEAVAAAEARHVDVHTRDAGRHGTVDVVASVDTADALDLEAAVAQAAAELKAGGSTESLDVRRSMALGVIARHYLGDALNTGRETGPLTKPRQVVINVHLRDARHRSLRHHPCPDLVEQVRGWCTNPDTQVIIRPIRDLNDHIRVDAYEVPDRLADQADERDGTCVHPWCTRPARSCDKDHCQPYDRGGTTASDNVAPLCRRTIGPRPTTGWGYRILRPGAYLWTSPTGLTYYRDGTGTTDLGRLSAA